MPAENPLTLLLRPAGTARPSRLAAAVIPFLALSAMLVLLAARAMPEGYSWLVHSISESAAQGEQGAWIARSSFLAFGAAVFLLSVAMRAQWPRVTYWSNLIFAASMIGAAAFSHAPWRPGVVPDQFEDFLHSVFATGMGFAYCAGVIARLIQRPPGAFVGRALDVVALAVATLLPLLAAQSDVGGLTQRIMFAVAYLWFARESLIELSIVNEPGRR